MLTLAQFRATRIAMTPDGAGEHLRDVSQFEDMPKDTVVWIYADTLYCYGQSSHKVTAPIECDEYEGALYDVEAMLYFFWYFSECAAPFDKVSTETLNVIYRGFYSWLNGTTSPPIFDARDLMRALEKTCVTHKRDKIAFLECWIKAYGAAEQRERGPVANDPTTWTETIWNALHGFRESCIPEGDELNDDQWGEICTAMAWIEEELGGAQAEKERQDRIDRDAEEVRKRIIAEVAKGRADRFYREPETETVTIHLPKRKAESLSFGLSDLLCWTQGFDAALTELDSRSGPMGTESARELNIALKDALSRADRGL